MTQKQKTVECGDELTAQPLTRREFEACRPANGVDNSGDWLRLPKPKQRLWGLSRTSWNELCESGAVKSITLRKKHAQRGIKLIYRPSAESYLKSLMSSESEAEARAE